MDWSNERYVRLYTRDTTEWVVWGWEANSLFCLMLRKADRTGVIEVGKHGHRGLAALLRMPDEVVERALKTLLDSGTVEWAGTDLVIRNFIEAQEASMSPVQRQRESRYRRRDLIRQGIDPDARECAVYFLQSEDGGSVKIGRADDLAKRLSQLQTARPDKLVVLAAVKGTIEDERSVHDLFADIREKGEWFSPHPKLMSFVKAIASGESLAVTLSRDWSRFATGHSDPCLAKPSQAKPSCADPDQPVRSEDPLSPSERDRVRRLSDRPPSPEQAAAEPEKSESPFDMAKRVFAELWQAKYREPYPFDWADNRPGSENRVLQKVGQMATERHPQRDDAERWLRHIVGKYLRDHGDRNWLDEKRHPLRTLTRDIASYGSPKPAPGRPRNDVHAPDGQEVTGIRKLASEAPSETPLSLEEHKQRAASLSAMVKAIGNGGGQ